VLQCHGDSDPVVPVQWGRRSYELLGGGGGAGGEVAEEEGFGLLGENLRWNAYAGMQHAACSEEIEDVANFLAEAFAIKR
jgi:predicted esterase